MKKIKRVQLEAEAFLSDKDFQLMDAEARGIYCTLIFFLYANGGKLELKNHNNDLLRDRTFEIALLSNCSKTGQEWKEIWSGIEHKFLIKGNILTHKRVTKELKKAYKYWKNKSDAGKIGMANRWDNTVNNTVNNNVITKERKGKESEGKESKDTSNTNARARTLSASVRFVEGIEKLLKPHTKSDKTAILNLTQWLMVEIKEGRKAESIFDKILDLAKEACNGKKPLALFFSLLDTQIGYRASSVNDKQKYK